MPTKRQDRRVFVPKVTLATIFAGRYRTFSQTCCRYPSLWDVLTIMERLTEANAGFRSLTEAIDTTAAGRMMLQMVGAFAEFKRAMLRERIKAGLDAARQEGRIGERRPKLSDQQRPKFER